MKKTTLFVLLTFLMLGFTNCTITKRSYRNGYHISWNKPQVSGKEKSTAVEIEKNDLALSEKEEAAYSENQDELTTSDYTLHLEKTEKIVTQPRVAKQKYDEKAKANENQTERSSYTATQQNRAVEDETDDERESNGMYIFRIILGTLLLLFLMPFIFGIGFLFLILALFGSDAFIVSGNIQLTELIFIGLGGVFAYAYFSSILYLIIRFYQRKTNDEVERKQKKRKAWIAALIAALVPTALAILAVFAL